MNTRILLLIPCILLRSLVIGQASIHSLIPAPQQVIIGEGIFTIAADTRTTVASPDLEEEGTYLRDQLKELLHLELMLLPSPMAAAGGIHLAVLPNDTVAAEGYTLTISTDRITIAGDDEAGVFRGITTLLNMMRAGEVSSATLGCRTIHDAPRFSWRGMHLDVCRHFFPIEFVKKYIDLLARYKMNRFHWHLTDDQGWRIEIKKYPKLTEVGAWRSGSQYGPYSQRTYDSTRYGGFYTQEQIREVVAYAQARHVTVVPEIEMPGHALAALAAYPELSCTGGPFEVAKGWGVFEDVFCPKEETFTFLENVLSEVIDLFPSAYIHIGGDECPKERWKQCSHCQQLMKQKGLKDEHELQSFFIQRIERYVNSKGRKIIGWDEILEGGLAPNAAVMSWRGTEGGIAAAQQSHPVVMSPGTHCYFDHYQGEPVNEPLAIGGYTTVQKTYAFEPVPSALSAKEAAFILGAQGNVWTEYILSPEHVEYMAVPRMLALAEVLWSPRSARNEADFVRRLRSEFPTLSALNVNYSTSLFDVGFSLKSSKKRGQVNVDLSATPGLGEIRYTLDGTEPTHESLPFTSTIEQRSSGTIRAALFNGMSKPGHSTSRTFKFDLGTGRAITTTPAPHERYNNGGAFTLVDGIVAGDKRVNHEWLGWRDEQVSISLDLGAAQWVSRISLGALAERHGWIHPPENVSISVSETGTDFIDLGSASRTELPFGHMLYSVSTPMTARYIKVLVKGIGVIPSGDPGAGDRPWMFLDELHVE